MREVQVTLFRAYMHLLDTQSSGADEVSCWHCNVTCQDAWDMYRAKAFHKIDRRQNTHSVERNLAHAIHASECRIFGALFALDSTPQRSSNFLYLTPFPVQRHVVDTRSNLGAFSIEDHRNLLECSSLFRHI